MPELEKRIQLDSSNLLQLLGLNDANINLLQSRFSALIAVRGESAFIKGLDSEVLMIERALKEMMYVINSTGTLKISDVELIIDLLSNGKPASKDTDLDSVILFTKDDAIKVRTAAQSLYFKAVQQNDICFAIGPAGTGKTFLAVAFAVSALKKSLVKKIILTRPAVEAGESLGFLPGDFKEKIDPYLRPLYDALEEMIPPEQLKSFLEKGIIEIVPLAYMRGRTLNRAFIILDEAQNATDIQMKMFLTRIGSSSRAIITGDVTQIDLPVKSVSGLIRAQEILQNIEGISFVYFEKPDVLRHKLVKDIIEAYEQFHTAK